MAPGFANKFTKVKSLNLYNLKSPELPLFGFKRDEFENSNDIIGMEFPSFGSDLPCVASVVGFIWWIMMAAPCSIFSQHHIQHGRDMTFPRNPTGTLGKYF